MDDLLDNDMRSGERLGELPSPGIHSNKNRSEHDGQGDKQKDIAKEK
jgi:hypothetical protein